MMKITDYPDEGKYNIRSVSRRTGIASITLRAWENRYQIINPKRSANGYRLYSERDIALLTWLKGQVETGISISTASANYRNGLLQGSIPEVIINPPLPVPFKHAALPTSEIINKLYDTLTTHNEIAASEFFDQALSSFSLLSLFESVISPVLVEIGEAWYHGRIRVATEHFASGFFRAKLLAIFQSLPVLKPLSHIMIGGAPGELHEIGALMIAILLREAGYQVEYLGPDLPLDDLVLYIKEEHPKMVILSATIKDSVEDLARFDQLTECIRPKPLFGFGGPAFNRHTELISQTPGIFLGYSFSQSISKIQALFGNKNKTPIAG